MEVKYITLNKILVKFKCFNGFKESYLCRLHKSGVALKQNQLFCKFSMNLGWTQGKRNWSEEAGNVVCMLYPVLMKERWFKELTTIESVDTLIELY